MKNDKYLMRLFDQISGEKIFFLFWGAIALFFVGLILRQLQKSQARNFRAETSRSKKKEKNATVQFRTPARLTSGEQATKTKKSPH